MKNCFEMPKLRHIIVSQYAKLEKEQIGIIVWKWLFSVTASNHHQLSTPFCCKYFFPPDVSIMQMLASNSTVFPFHKLTVIKSCRITLWLSKESTSWENLWHKFNSNFLLNTANCLSVCNLKFWSVTNQIVCMSVHKYLFYRSGPCTSPGGEWIFSSRI